jgi:hypothetical protein
MNPPPSIYVRLYSRRQLFYLIFYFKLDCNLLYNFRIVGDHAADSLIVRVAPATRNQEPSHLMSDDCG